MKPFLFFEAWEVHYTKSQSRRYSNLPWVAQSTKFDNELYRSLVRRKNGEALYGAFRAMVGLAARCTPRGVLARCCGDAHDHISIADAVGMRRHVVRAAIDACIEISLMQCESTSERASERISEYTSERAPELRNVTEHNNGGGGNGAAIAALSDEAREAFLQGLEPNERKNAELGISALMERGATRGTVIDWMATVGIAPLAEEFNSLTAGRKPRNFFGALRFRIEKLNQRLLIAKQGTSNNKGAV